MEKTSWDRRRNANLPLPSFPGPPWTIMLWAMPTRNWTRSTLVFANFHINTVSPRIPVKIENLHDSANMHLAFNKDKKKLVFAEQHKALAPETFGSKKNHQLVLAAWNKRLPMDLLRQNVAKLGCSAPRRTKKSPPDSQPQIDDDWWHHGQPGLSFVGTVTS